MAMGVIIPTPEPVFSDAITAMDNMDDMTRYQQIAITYGKGVAVVAAIHTVLRPISMIVCGIHGYRRNDSNTGAGVLWGAGGFFFPIVAPIVAFAQGYGKPPKRTAMAGARGRRRRSRSRRRG